MGRRFRKFKRVLRGQLLMFGFDLLIVLTLVSAAVAGVFWLRVLASNSLKMAGKLDGTEELAERANRRALSGARAATVLTLVLAFAAYMAGKGAGAF